MPDYLITGVGGQGTVLASKMIAAAAINSGFNVRTTETIGMAQRGGSVVSHVRVGDVIYSPMIPLGRADALIAFEPIEAARCLPYLSDRGKLIVCDTAVGTEQADAGQVLDYLRYSVPGAVILPGERIKALSARTLNVTILAAAAEYGMFPFGAEALKTVITSLIPQRYWEMNNLAFGMGREIYSEIVGRH
ncbi:MAG: indolepyruvate oxidoreductase subunit beta [Oscillospiraceae bacterium]|nr:indolepyruvate oxidoreductase subunit beta [Oscillospiraceae bacterium]